MDKVTHERVTLTINTTINSFLGNKFPNLCGAWAMPCTIRNLPNQGESK